MALHRDYDSLGLSYGIRLNKPGVVSPAHAALERSRLPHCEAISRKAYQEMTAPRNRCKSLMRLAATSLNDPLIS